MRRRSRGGLPLPGPRPRRTDPQGAGRSRPVETLRHRPDGNSRRLARAPPPLDPPDPAPARSRRHRLAGDPVAFEHPPPAPATGPVANPRLGEPARGKAQFCRCLRRRDRVQRRDARPACADRPSPGEEQSGVAVRRCLPAGRSRRLLPRRDGTRHRGHAQAGAPQTGRSGQAGRR